MSALRRFVLATYGPQRRPRVVQREHEKYAKAYARHWYEVEAENAEQARALIARLPMQPEAGKGRLIDCGSHGPGGMPPNRTPRRGR